MTTAVSAPGKVLLTGGYLVLDREFTGLVFGLSARIHVFLRPLRTSVGDVVVSSPQFRDARWEYGCKVAAQGGGIEVTQLGSSAQSPNPFVETTLAYVLSYVSSIAPPVIQPAAITILADNDYYSDATTLPADRGQRFVDFNVPLSEAHKTGLGSSAALVTALTAGLLLHYLPKGDFSLESENNKAILHNLAQTAHCAAQGKVGSGFDVASAVYGSSLYRRFSPSLLADHGNPGSPGFAESIRSLVRDRQWDTEILKAAVKVPPGIRLVMCDVDCGSQTPGMVKQVLAWRNREPDEAGMIWSALHRRNEALAAELTRLADTQAHDYGKLEKCIIDIRVLVREMSRLSGVPIEPEQQTQLLDACTAIDGVVGGVVPGAGGYDAIALLVEDKDEVLSRLRRLLAGWEVVAVTGTEGSASQSIGKVKLLDVREEMEGVRTEDASTYGPIRTEDASTYGPSSFIR